MLPCTRGSLEGDDVKQQVLQRGWQPNELTKGRPFEWNGWVLEFLWKGRWSFFKTILVNSSFIGNVLLWFRHFLVAMHGAQFHLFVLLHKRQTLSILNISDRQIDINHPTSLQMPFCYASNLATSLVAIYHQPAWCFFSSLITLSSSITLPCHWGEGKKWRQDGGAGIDDWSYNRHMGWLQPQKLMMDQCCQLQKTANSRRK